jgi:hypothetical protein
MLICAIDPGNKGAIVLFRDNKPEKWTPMPAVDVSSGKRASGKARAKKEVHLPDMVKVLDEYCEGVDLVVVEHPPFIPGNGVFATAALFRNFGEIRGYVAARKTIPILAVLPTVWKANVLKGTAKDKKATIAFVRNLYPGFDIRLDDEDHDGAADAVCLAEYGRRTFSPAC